MKYTTLAILAGFLLDQLFGDPYWLPHPIRAIGWLISKGETWIRGILPKTPMGEKTGGFFLVALVLGVTWDTGFWHFVPGCSYSPIGGTDSGIPHVLPASGGKILKNGKYEGVSCF